MNLHHFEEMLQYLDNIGFSKKNVSSSHIAIFNFNPSLLIFLNPPSTAVSHFRTASQSADTAAPPRTSPQQFRHFPQSQDSAPRFR